MEVPGCLIAELPEFSSSHFGFLDDSVLAEMGEVARSCRGGRQKFVGLVVNLG